MTELSSYPDVASLIDGRWIRRGDGAHQVLNPSTEDTLAELPLVGPTDLDQALHAADRAFKTWSRTPAIERAAVLERAAQLMREREDRIAGTLLLEQGKVWSSARFEVRAAAESLRWHAEEARRVYGRVIPARLPRLRQFVLREPVGVVAAFTPWNFPALTPVRKIAAALAAGCTMVMKGAEESPGTLVLIAQCLVDAGLLGGVLNLVFGVPHQVSEHLLSSPIVRKLSITGSTDVGKQLGRLAMNRVIPATMELGGHAPVIVFDDADPQAVTDALAPKKLLSSGQNCISPSRLFVQRPVYDRVVELLAQWAASVRVGNPMDEDVEMGPVSNARRLDAMCRLVHTSVATGARLAAGGERLARRGFFHQMTLLADVPDHAPAMQEEPFGPLLLVTPFDDDDEAISRANALPFGLAGYAFTQSDARAFKVSEELQVGMLGINHMQIASAEAPFGGMKESGIGRENGSEGLEPYLQTKFVAHMVI